MKTFNVFGTLMQISIASFCDEIAEYCVYYNVVLQNKLGDMIFYHDFDYSDTDDIDENYLFKLFLSRGCDCFDNAMDKNGDMISKDVFVDFLGDSWFDEFKILHRISK